MLTKFIRYSPDSLNRILINHNGIVLIYAAMMERVINSIVHMDPIMVGDEETNELKRIVEDIVKEISPELKIHDFRIVSGPTHTNVLFDIVVPYKFKLTDEELKNRINEGLEMCEDKKYYAVINIDRAYV